MNRSTMMTCLFLILVTSCWHVGCQRSNRQSAQEIAKQWQQDPEKTIVWLQQLSAEEQDFYAMYLVESDPKNAHLLCERFTSNQDRHRCTKLGQRPHLWTPISSRPTSSRIGPSGTHLKPTQSQHSLFAIDSTFTPCSDETSDLKLHLEQPLPFAFRTQIVSIKYNALDNHWRHECYFEAAEIRIQQSGDPTKQLPRFGCNSVSTHWALRAIVFGILMGSLLPKTSHRLSSSAPGKSQLNG